MPSMPGSMRSSTIGVVLGRLRHPERIVAGSGHVDRVALLDQPTPKQARHLQLVLDHEQAHLSHIVAQKMRVG